MAKRNTGKGGTSKTPASRTAKKKSPTKSTLPARKGSSSIEGPVTLEEARAIVQVRAPARTARRGLTPNEKTVTLASVAEERNKLEERVREENERRIREYKATISILKQRGVRFDARRAPKGRRRGITSPASAVSPPLRILAEGDSWFDYPVPFFGGGVIARLENRIGLPILSLAKAGDEVRKMLGVSERQILIDQLSNGSPAGGSWDVLLFSGGGNDIVGNPMALWIQDFKTGVPPANLLNKARFEVALKLVQAGYEDLIEMRDTLSPSTHLMFHGYDFAIPDGRGICGMGPWLKPAFDLRRFPSLQPALAVVKSMLQQFAAMLQAFASSHRDVTFVNTQGVLQPVTASWHNELHPSKSGFNSVADIFHLNLKTLFPNRVR